MLEEEDLVVRAGGGNGVPHVVERLVAGVRVERYVEHARVWVRFADLRVIELLRQALVRLLAQLARLVDHQSHNLLAHAAAVYGSAARFICDGEEMGPRHRHEGHRSTHGPARRRAEEGGASGSC